MLNTNQVIGLVLVLIVIGFVLPIGMNIYYKGYDTISNVNLGSTGNTTRTALDTAVWGAFSMATVLPTIAGGAAVIAAVVVGFLIYRSR